MLDPGVIEEIRKQARLSTHEVVYEIFAQRGRQRPSKTKCLHGRNALANMPRNILIRAEVNRLVDAGMAKDAAFREIGDAVNLSHKTIESAYCNTSPPTAKVTVSIGDQE